MEGGYINEGGQLKTKNGQKYVVNDTRQGIFISKACAVLTAIIAILTLIAAILATYFLVSLQKPNESYPAPGQNINDSIAAASFVGNLTPPKPTNKTDKPIENGVKKPKEDEFKPPKDEIFIKDEASASKKIKLYEGWNPEIYWLVIEPNLKTSTNNGTVTIQINRDRKIQQLQPIVLDIHNITIHNARVTKTTKDIKPLEIKTGYGENNETFYIKLMSDMSDYRASLKVRLDFTSHLTDTLQGIYKTHYENVYNGKMESVVSTQLSPIDARRAFPCFDRPDKKANFSISVVRESDKLMSLSNMPLHFAMEQRPGFIKEEFKMTPKMPTYLVAFIVSNLVKSNYSETDRNQHPAVEIWTRPEVSHMTKYAYETTRKVLPFYEKFFGIPFKLPKIDFVSIPDFGFGAMENWGLITFRDAAILVPEGKDQSSSAAHKEHVASIIAHELAHQWFGNLVTPKWWDDLWLKEGFASYMSYLAIDMLEPEWRVNDTFAVDEFQQSMEEDSDASSHPIAFPVSSTSDIRRIFDPITYSKGVILVRMVNSMIGEEAFKNAVKDFLKQFAYQNALRDDLWKLMTYYAHALNTLPKSLNVKDIMDSWTQQAGYPVVNVERTGKDLVITQQRHLLPKSDGTDETKWYVPITFDTNEKKATSTIPSHWMTKDNHSIVIPDVFASANNSDEYAFVNLNRMGYYRVNYDYNLWIALKKYFKDLPPLTRAQLLDDALNLARSENLSYDVPLTFLLEMYAAVDDHLLWAAAQDGLNYLNYMLRREPAFETFRAFFRYIVRPAFDKYGLNEPDDETHVQLIHRARVAKLACRFSYDRCTNAAQLKYREWMYDAKRNPIKPNLKLTIYCNALEAGNFQEWYFALNRYKETMNASEKEQILTALGCTKLPWLLSKYLNMTIDSKSGIRKQDGACAFSAVAKNSIGYEIAFDFLVTNIKEISEYFGDGFETLSKMIYSVTTYMNKDHHLEQLALFAAKARKLGLKSIETTIQLATEQVKNNIHWRSNAYYKLKGFLETIVEEFHINLY